MGFILWYRAGRKNGLRLFALAAGVGLCALAQGGMWAQAPAASAQPKTMLVEPPAPLLPATLGKLKRLADGDVGDGLGQLDPANAAVLKEDGLKRFARSEYVDGGQHVDVTVYRFIDASGAISAYDFFMKPGMRSEKMGDGAVTSGSELLMRSGVNVVQENFKDGTQAKATLTNELIEHLPKVAGPAAMDPLLPTLLPAKGFDADSVRYALGPSSYSAMGGVLPADAVGFDKSAETVTARSKNGGLLTLLLYPTPQIAGERGRAIEALLNQRVAAGGESRAALGTVMMRREGPLVAMTTGAWKPDEAKKMVDGIHLSSEVTFDKPMPVEFHAEVKKTYSLLQSVVIFCALSAAAMVILGLFLGGGRALVRVMQGKPAASEPEFLHIDLSGPRGKPFGGSEG